MITRLQEREEEEEEPHREHKKKKKQQARTILSTFGESEVNRAQCAEAKKADQNHTKTRESGQDNGSLWSFARLCPQAEHQNA